METEEALGSSLSEPAEADEEAVSPKGAASGGISSGEATPVKEDIPSDEHTPGDADAPLPSPPGSLSLWERERHAAGAADAEEAASKGDGDDDGPPDTEALPFEVDAAFLEAAHKLIAAVVPEVAEAKPQVRPMPPHILLLYTVTVPVLGGPPSRPGEASGADQIIEVTRIVRAVVDAQGQLVKLSTSRG